MRIVLAGYGSRGDVEPCAVVGRELQRRGHDVRIAVPPNLLGFVEKAGLTATAYGQDSHAQLDGASDFFVANMKNPYGSLPQVAERAANAWMDKGTALASLAEGADLLISGMNERRLAANIAEYQNIPLVSLHFFPSRIQPSGALNESLAKMSEEPLRRALGMPEAVVPPPAASITGVSPCVPSAFSWSRFARSVSTPRLPHASGSPAS